MHQTLAALTAMRIRFPGKTEEEADSVLDEVGTYCYCVCMCATFYNTPMCILVCVKMFQIQRPKQCKHVTK